MTKKDYEKSRLKFKKQYKEKFDKASKYDQLLLENQELKNLIHNMENKIEILEDWNRRLLEFINLDEENQSLLLSSKKQSIDLTEIMEQLLSYI